MFGSIGLPVILLSGEAVTPLSQSVGKLREAKSQNRAGLADRSKRVEDWLEQSERRGQLWGLNMECYHWNDKVLIIEDSIGRVVNNEDGEEEGWCTVRMVKSKGGANK